MDNGRNTPTQSQPVTPKTSALKPPPSNHKRQLPRRLLYLLGGLSIAALLAYLLRPQPIAVDMGTIERGTLQVTVNAEGKTRVRDRFVIAAPVDGRLQRIDLEAGDPVQSGMRVAQLDPLPYTTQVQTTQAHLRELQAQLAGVETRRPKAAALQRARSRIQAAQDAKNAAQARVAQAEAALEQAKRDRERAATLYQNGAIPRQNLESAQLAETTQSRELDVTRRQFDSAITDVNAATNDLNILQAEQRDPDYLLNVYRAQIAAAKAELANLTDEAHRTDIRSPASGQVLRVLQKSASYVTAGTSLIEVGNASHLELVIDVLSSDAVQIKPNDRILIEHWGGDTTLNARVRSVEPSAFTKVSALGVEEQRVNVIADFTDPAVPLGDGYRVETQIITQQENNVLKVPISALFRCQTDWCTFVVKQGRAQPQHIEIGPRNEFAAVVKTGLQAGETVILHPTEQITAGHRVIAR
jgi:HlyD family secretion protein